MNRIIKRFLVCLVFAIFATFRIAAQYNVFDPIANVNAINNLYALYDQINSTIENVQNGYQQLQNALEQAKGLMDGEMKLSDWTDDWWKNIGIARDRMKQANGYISYKVDEATRIKNKIKNTKFYELEGESYNLADLLGIGKKGYRKSLISAVINTEEWRKQKIQSIKNGYKAMSFNERQKALINAGFSPNTAEIAIETQQVATAVADALAGADAFDEETYWKNAQTDLQASHGAYAKAEQLGTDAARIQALNTSMLGIQELLWNWRLDGKRFLAYEQGNLKKEEEQTMLLEESRKLDRQREIRKAYNRNVGYSSAGVLGVRRTN